MRNDLAELLKAIQGGSRTDTGAGRPPINDAITNEIIRKAQAGVPLTDPTPEKQTIYDRYISGQKPIAQTAGGQDSPIYGQEVARPTQEEALTGLVKAITSYRQDNPIKLPFPSGTPTLAAKQFSEQFAEQQRQNALSNQLARQSQGISAGNAARAAAAQDFNQKMNIWQATGLAPGGIKGVDPGTVYGGDMQGQQDSIGSRVATIEASLAGMSPQDAYDMLTEHAQGTIADIGYEEYYKLLSKYGQIVKTLDDGMPYSPFYDQ